MKKIVLVLILFLFPAAVFAGEYVLIKGKGVEVCEAHFKNLKPLTLNEMVCKRDESYPEANDITRPEWEEMDLRENKELVKRIAKFFALGDQFIKDEMLDSDGYFNNHLLKYNSLKKTTANIANNGKPEIVMLYRKPRCDVERNIAYNIPYSRPLFVLDEPKNQIDVKKTEPLLQNTTNRNADIFIKSHSNYMLYNVFFHKKTAYFDKWDVDDWTLTVYRQSKSKVEEVCKYNYQQTKNKED